MAGAWGRRARMFALVLSAILHLTRAQGKFVLPPVSIRAFTPKGLEVSIPDEPGIGLFAFQGNVNRDISSTRVGNLKGEALTPSSGRWVIRDDNAELKAGDVVNYYVFVSHNRVGYLKDNLSFTIPELEDRSATTTTPTATPPITKPTTSTCEPTVTMVRGGKACAGQTIFEDQFNDLNRDVWQIEQYIPISHPEYPFVSYQRLASSEVLTVSDGNLRISPKLQQSMPGFTNESIFSGELDLFSGCTAGLDACFRQASGPDILPPVVSGRITSTGFAFTYGTVYIRAKLPKGDWIYPELLLEPFLSKYGRSNFASGVIKIASARGNKELRAAPDDYSNKVLYGGPIMDFQCRHELLTNKIMTGRKMWGDDFHEYSVRWAPDHIALSVDGEEWARIDASQPLRERFPQRCTRLPRMLLSRGTNLAPFDDYFYLTLGVAVGGISEFRDNTYTSGGLEKPWVNSGRKAMLNFWEALDSWQPTWTQPALLVDYVKVVAL